jgi:hypothetical protein
MLLWWRFPRHGPFRLTKLTLSWSKGTGTSLWSQRGGSFGEPVGIPLECLVTCGDVGGAGPDHDRGTALHKSDLAGRHEKTRGCRPAPRSPLPSIRSRASYTAKAHPKVCRRHDHVPAISSRSLVLWLLGGESTTAEHRADDAAGSTGTAAAFTAWGAAAGGGITSGNAASAGGGGAVPNARGNTGATAGAIGTAGGNGTSFGGLTDKVSSAADAVRAAVNHGLIGHCLPNSSQQVQWASPKKPSWTLLAEMILFRQPR